MLLLFSTHRVGQTFLSFQWDILLLETGALAIFVAPLFSRSRYERYTKAEAVLVEFVQFIRVVVCLRPCRYDLASPTSPLSTFMVRWLLFRLMFLSGTQASAISLFFECSHA